LTKTAAPPAFFDVPAGTRPTLCKGSTCGRAFYWIRDAKGFAIPVDCDVPGGVKPSAHVNDPRQQSLFGETKAEKHHNGRGVRHHTVCPDVEEFRRSR